MGRVLHGSAGATEAVRRAIQHIQESVGKRAKPLWLSINACPANQSLASLPGRLR